MTKEETHGNPFVDAEQKQDHLNINIMTLTERLTDPASLATLAAIKVTARQLGKYVPRTMFEAVNLYPEDFANIDGVNADAYVEEDGETVHAGAKTLSQLMGVPQETPALTTFANLADATTKMSALRTALVNAGVLKEPA